MDCTNQNVDGETCACNDTGGEFALTDKNNMRAWVEHYARLLNVEFECPSNELSDVPPTAGPLPNVSVTLIHKALGKMKCSKSAGIVAEMLKAAGEEGVELVRQLTKAVFSCGMIPIRLGGELHYDKGKAEALDRGNYRGLKLTYQVMKLLERVPHSYILEMMTIDEMQWASRSLGDEEWAVRVFHGMYSNVWSYVRLNCQYIEEFGAGVGVNQCSVLSPLLCILVLEALSHKFHTDVPWELLYTGDPVFIADTQQECISKLKAWKVGMESKGLCVNMKKTKFLFSGNGHDVLKKSVLSAAMVSSTTPSNAHRVCRGSTRSTVASLSDWRPTQTMSAPGVRASLGLLMAELWLRWISTAPCLMWKPLSATEVICYAPVGAVTVPLLPDVVWPGESSGNSCLS